MDSKQKEFSQLIKANQGLIIKVSRLYTNSLEDEQDLFQEIVLQLWRSYDSFKGDSKFSTWMYRVSLNTAITLIRKKTKSSETDFNEAQFLNLKSEDKDEFLEERITLLYAAIRLLNDVERALVLLFLEDLPYKDIAETLGISEVNARVKMNRVKIKLKEIMSKMEQ